MNKYTNTNTLLICLTILLIFFAGDPDIADGVIKWLMK